MDDISFREALEMAKPRMDALHLRTTAALDQIIALWRDLKPAVVAWVAQADGITEQQWMDMPEEYHEYYVALKRLLVIDEAG